MKSLESHVPELLRPRHHVSESNASQQRLFASPVASLQRLEPPLVSTISYPSRWHNDNDISIRYKDV